MKLNRCPICHSLFDVMTLAQDEATQELLVRLAKFDTQTGTALLSYLSLFCPPKSQLSADRSLTLINELETLEDGNWQRLGLAMATVSAVMQDKKRGGKPVSQFKNHNYLKKVLAEMDTQPPVALPPQPQANISPIAIPQPMIAGKTLTAIGVLEQMKNE
ncbi:MAG: hypothetical protein KGV56_00240 [Gammaproteobacteria bacterium]|nr:hypothetical protein [Gammaproteobacteria bacterium]